MMRKMNIEIKQKQNFSHNSFGKIYWSLSYILVTMKDKVSFLPKDSGSDAKITDTFHS